MKLKKFRYQAAGHDGPLTNSDEMLLFKPTCPEEIEFYESVATRPIDEEGDDVPLRLWMPSFLGTLNAQSSPIPKQALPEDYESPPAESNAQNGVYLVLENLVFGYVRPNVLDIKLGKILWDDKASCEKKERLKEVSKNSTSGTLGFRICGMNMEKNKRVEQLDPALYEETDDGYVFVNKIYGRQLSVESTIDAFRLYFGSGLLSVHEKTIMIEAFLNRLKLFYNTILCEEVRMISSSLLLVFEGDTSRWKKNTCNHELVRPSVIDSELDGEENSDSDEATKEISTLSSMSIIDFAHSRLVPGEGHDENIIVGIENLIDIFEKLKLDI